MRARRPDFVGAQFSDIHFRFGRVGDLHEQDSEIRHELELDLRRVANLVQRVDALIVPGDIAFAGKEAEYQIASPWLNSVAEQVGCDRGSVLVTPGNHDIDRDVLISGCDALQVHEDVQNASSQEERDRILSTCLRDASRGAALFAPLAAYNAFASEYGCQIGPDMPYWERFFPLRDGSSLCIRGLNSTLISGPRDELKPQNLAYGAAQRIFLRKAEWRRMLVAHHPPSWTCEGETAAEVFSKRNLLQLFGHRHASWIGTQDNSVRIISGAVHPDRREGEWDPRYNVIALTVSSPTTLHVCVYPRRWSREELSFVPDRLGDGSSTREFTLAIDRFDRPAPAQHTRANHVSLIDWRSISERLLKAGPDSMRQIATDLSLFIEAENRARPMALLSAAVTAGKLEVLEAKLAAIESAEPDPLKP